MALLNQDPEVLKKLRELVQGDLDSTRRLRDELKEKLETRKSLYTSELPQRQYAGRANVRVPFPYTYVETMLPRYMQAFFGGPEILDAYCRIGKNFQGALTVRRLLNFQLLYEADLFWQALMFHTALTREAVAIMKVKWNNEAQAPSLHLVRPDEYCMDPRANSLKSAAWVAHLIGKTRAEVRAGAVEGKYIPETSEKLLAGKPNTVLANGVVLPEARGVHQAWEWWGEADPGPEEEAQPDGTTRVIEGVRPLVVLLTEAGDLLSVNTSAYGKLVPFVGATEVPSPWQFMDTRSEIDTLQSMYEAASDIINQRMDNVTLNINGLWTYKMHSGIDVSRLVSSPWAIIPVRSHEDLKRWETPSVTNDAYREVGSMVDLMKFSSGLEDIMRGAMAKGERTASEVEKASEFGSARPGLKVMMSQWQFLKRLGEIVLEEDQMFLSRNKAVLAVGEEGVESMMVSPESLGTPRQWEIMPTGFALSGNKAVRVGNLNNTLNMLRGYPELAPLTRLVIKEILSLYNVRVPPELAPLFDAPPVPPPALRQVAEEQLGSSMFNLATRGPQGAPGGANVPTLSPQGPAAPPIPLR